jgi:succinyl-diaminopimelate desuccinylase
MDKQHSVIETTCFLIRKNTINPPGNEADAAAYLGRRLEDAGFRVTLYPLAAERACLVAELNGVDNDRPLCFTGHLDTVPLGATSWSVDPFGGHLADGKIYGRGSSDMKGGVAAIVEAAIRVAHHSHRRALKLIFTAGEETGCEGAAHLAKSGVLGQAGAIVVAEPSSNRPLIGHRGVLWLQLDIAGRTAHGSMPHLGDNAVIKAAQTIAALKQFKFDIEPHAHLGSPNLSVGYCHGGANINSVPDHAEIGLDIRTIPSQSHDSICDRIVSQARVPVTLKRLLDLQGVFTPTEDPWIQRVFEIAAEVTDEPTAPTTAPYFTDASILTATLRNPPTIILGPGAMELAHQTDEYCDVERLRQAVEIYERLAIG